MTPEERKIARRAKRMERHRREILQQMEHDVAILRKIIRGPGKAEPTEPDMIQLTTSIIFTIVVGIFVIVGFALSFIYQ